MSTGDVATTAPTAPETHAVAMITPTGPETFVETVSEGSLAAPPVCETLLDTAHSRC